MDMFSDNANIYKCSTKIVHSTLIYINFFVQFTKNMKHIGPNIQRLQNSLILVRGEAQDDTVKTTANV
jgi:hypothetical protein